MQSVYKLDFLCSNNEQTQALLNELYEYNSPETKVHHRNRINLFWLLMCKLKALNKITKFDTAIDIGCNSGFYTKLISDSGFKRVLGIDIVEEMIEKANRNFRFAEGDSELLCILRNAENIAPPPTYDFILCTEVIEHLDNPFKVSENIKEVLSNGGIAVISMPNAFSFPYFVIRLLSILRIRKLSKGAKQHMEYPFWKIIALFKRRDIKIIEKTGYNLFLNGPLFSLVYNSRFFNIINKMNFYLSQLPILKYCSQFFFIVIKKE